MEYKFIGMELRKKEEKEITNKLNIFIKNFLMGFWFFITVPMLLSKKKKKH